MDCRLMTVERCREWTVYRRRFNRRVASMRHGRRLTDDDVRDLARIAARIAGRTDPGPFVRGLATASPYVQAGRPMPVRIVTLLGAAVAGCMRERLEQEG